MPGPYTSSEFTRGNAEVMSSRSTWNVPYETRLYWPHASGLCHMLVWWPSATFTDAPVAVVVHDSMNGEIGVAAMTTDTITGKFADLCAQMSSDGYVVISIDYPMGGAIFHTRVPAGTVGATKVIGSWKEQHPLAMWPEQANYVAYAIQQIKSNAVDGYLHDDYFGAGNTIDPNRIVLLGKGWGATCALFAALQPSAFYSHERTPTNEAMDPYVPRASHRVRRLILHEPTIDLTQLYLGPTPAGVAYGGNGTTDWTNPPGNPAWLQGDRFPPFMRCESERRWSLIDPRWKKQSPWWILQEGFSENNNLAMFVEYEQVSVGAWDASLTDADWSPGTVLDTYGTGRAWVHPYHSFQGPPLLGALQAHGTSSSTIRTSIVRAADSDYLPYSQAAYTPAVMDWLVTL